MSNPWWAYILVAAGFGARLHQFLASDWLTEPFRVRLYRKRPYDGMLTDDPPASCPRYAFASRWASDSIGVPKLARYGTSFNGGLVHILKTGPVAVPDIDPEHKPRYVMVDDQTGEWVFMSHGVEIRRMWHVNAVGKYVWVEDDFIPPTYHAFLEDDLGQWRINRGTWLGEGWSCVKCFGFWITVAMYALLHAGTVGPVHVGRVAWYVACAASAHVVTQKLAR
jgi:hypothetical protein